MIATIALVIYFAISMVTLYLIAKRVIALGVDYKLCFRAVALSTVFLLLIGYGLNQAISPHFLVLLIIAVGVNGVIYKLIFNTSYDNGFKVATIQALILFAVRLVIGITGMAVMRH